jgi:aryl-alcohol dehydrogenase-like predicted oxidoreductase
MHVPRPERHRPNDQRTERHRHEDAESIRAIHRALDLGVTHLDTAEIYGPTNRRALD